MPLETLVLRLWQWRGRVLLLALLLFSAGAFTVFSLPRSFVAEAVVAPSETTGIATSSLLSVSPAISGLLDPRPTGNFAIYLGALRSAEAAMRLVEATPLLAVLAERRAAGPMGALRQALGLQREMDLDDARNWLARNLAVTQTLGSVTWTLSLAHPDRDQALATLRHLHAFAEAKVRADLEEMARRRVVALEARLAREQDLYIRQSLYEVLAQQQRVGLVVAVDEAVAARLVSAPLVEQRASLPNRPLLLLLLLVTAPLAALAMAAAAILLSGLRRASAMPPRAVYRMEPAE